MTVDYRVGDVRDVMAAIPDGSVSLVASSPPFLALRSYLPAGHDAKHAEIGSEPDPATFLDTLLGLTAEWGRVLAPWGSIAIELGDTYAGGGGDKHDGGLERKIARNGYGGASGRLDAIVGKSGGTWPRPKSLALIPQLYATSLAYGRNILTGAESPAGQWLVRNVIVWHRPNPAVGALGDKFRPSTSYITVATRSAKRWFDLTAVRGEPSSNTHARTARGVDVRPTTGKAAERDGNYHTLATQHLGSAGAPPLDTWLDEYDGTNDTWTLTTQPSKLAHYAMWPAKLAERLILSMCPLEVCSVCGEPRRRVEGAAEYVSTNGGRVVNQWAHERVGPGVNTWAVEGSNPGHAVRTAPTLGWSDCGHDDYRPGVVFDPFAGTGTTLAVADLHGRDGIGIDLDPRNELLYERRREECHRALFGVTPQIPGQLNFMEALG